MSSEYTLGGGPRAGLESPRRGAARWARPLLVAMSVLCAAILAGRFIAEPVMQIRHVVVHSDLPLADDQVLALSGMSGAEHWYSVATPAIEKKLEASPLVRRAEVVKVFPDTLRMTVWGRAPAGLILAASGGKTVPVLVDGDGVVYKIGTSSAEVDLPVVSGLTAGDTALGAALPRAYGPLFAGLRALRESAPSLYALVSEVRVVNPPAPDAAAAASGGAPGAIPAQLEMLVWLTCSPVPVRARGTVDETLLRSTLMVLDLLSRQRVLQNIQELDFRSGDVVYRTKTPRQGSREGG